MDFLEITGVIIASIVAISTIYVNHLKKIKKLDNKSKSIKKSFNWNFFSKINIKQ